MRKLSHVASRISDGVIITNKDGLVDWVNEGFIRQSGYQLKEVKGHKPGLLLQGARTDPSTIARMHERLQAGEGFIVQLVNYTKQQQPYWVQLEVQPVYDRDRQLSNYIGVARNITRDKQELRDQRLETIGNVASGLAHDLNNILAPITLSIEMLKETYPESDEMVDTIEQCATRASFMVQQLLNYVKGQAGALSIFDLSEVLNQTLDLLRFSLPKRISLHYEPLPTPTQIHGDSTQVQQLLVNLAVNARDAMPDGGKLSLSAREVELSSEHFKAMILCSEKAKPGRYGLISLADEGTGIEPSHVERIFEPFFTTKSPEEGTGLGLAAVAGIIKGHNGLIHVESQLGEGTTFMIYLPISIDQEEVKDTSAA
jgi:PAS domain S-box-containing protein